MQQVQHVRNNQHNVLHLRIRTIIYSILNIVMSNCRKSQESERRKYNQGIFDYTFYAGSHVQQRECRNPSGISGNQVSRGQNLVDYESSLLGLSSKPYSMGSDSRQPVKHLPDCSISSFGPQTINHSALPAQSEYNAHGRGASFRYAANI